ncbi:MAG: hypothetical protein KDB03_16195 [Planctomycetales bacterium]|nr:hypothetical protein [Planctomycetales bacterium]
MFELFIRLRRRNRWIVLGFIACCCGCSGNTATVSGKVTFEGVPVERGAITFFPEDGTGPTAGAPITNGEYLATEVPIGKKTVKINGVKIIGREPMDSSMPDSPMRDLTEELLPKKYNGQSELVLEVKPPKTQQDYNLTK